MKIKVIGVGGGGVNTINRMINAKIENVEFYAMNTDASMLRRSICDNKIQLGIYGLGVGGDPQKGKKYAEESIDKLKNVIYGADVVIITIGMGGGTGTGASAVIAKLAKEQKILTIAVVSKPLNEEGIRRNTIAIDGLKELKQHVDKLFVINSNKACPARDNKFSLDTIFKVLDDTLRISVETITNTIVEDNKNNLDIKTSLDNATNKILKLDYCDICE